MKLNSRLLNEARQYQIVFILSICLSLLAGILSIFQAHGVSKLINQVFLNGQGLISVSRILITLFIIMLLRAGLGWCGDWLSYAGARRIKQNLRERLFRQITNIGPAYLRNEAGELDVRTGELINVTTEGIDALESYYSQYLPQIALSASIPIIILLFIFPTDLLSGMILLVTAPLLPLFMYLIGGAAETVTRKQWKGLSRMSAYFLDVLQGLATLKSFGRSKDQVEVIGKVSENYRESTMGVLKVTFLSAMVLELIATLSTAVVAVEIGVRLLYGKVSFEQAFFVLLLAPEFYHPLRLLGTRFHAAMGGIEASKRIFGILDIPVRKEACTSSSTVLPFLKDNPLPAILLKDISYKYSNDRPALQGVTFEIPAGKMTALVGESGAGKTTLTWLLLRFLQPNNGEIYVNGVNLSEISPQLWRDNLAWVPQHPYLFNDTISANIKIANPDASDADIHHAARLAHADEFIAKLPQGYATIIGERGERLSSGQAQRVALARAFLKDAPLLILDEATSHLDPETDALLQESLLHLSHSRTVLVIAHRQSTLTKADQVITLCQGKVEQIQENSYTTGLSQVDPQGIFQSPTVHIPIIQTEDSWIHNNQDLKKTSPKSVELRLTKLLSPFSGRILLSIFLGFATIASGIGLLATSAYIISAAALHPSIAELQVAIVGVRFFGLSRGVFRYLERLVSHDVTFRLLARWRVWFFQALEPLAPARLMQFHSGDLLSRVIGDIGILEGFYVRAITPPLVAILVTLGMGVFFNNFGPEFTWILIIFLVMGGLGLPVLSSFLSHRLGPQLVQARAHLSREIIDGIQGLPDLLTSCQAEVCTQRVDRAGKHLAAMQSRIVGISAMQSAIGGLISNLCMLTILIFAIHSVSTGQLSGVLLGVLALGALTCFEAVQPLPIAAQNLEANRAAARRLYELVDTTPIVRDPVESLLLPEDNHISVKDLSFHYPTQVNIEPPGEILNFELENISFSLPQGKHIAIVGPSGSGKTTLINLLQRFWEYQQGSIQLSGNEFHQYTQEAILSRIAAIPQNTYLFSTTVKQNLLIARPEASDNEIILATQAAHVHNMIQSLPNGYDTWVGEHGLQLSAGERQRLAIARALLKDSPLLILDEPSSNLDPVTEAKVLDSVRKLSFGRSTITISQRFVGFESMDGILVLKDGQLIEYGSHEVLLSKRGLYYQMWALYNQII